VTPGQQRDKSLIDGGLLAEDDSADALPHLAQAMAERLDLGSQIVGRMLLAAASGGQGVGALHAGASLAGAGDGRLNSWQAAGHVW
jgi:hypothetical protein